MAQGRDFIEVLVEDHREAEATFEEIEKVVRQGRGADATRQARTLADLVIAELVRHSVAEEEYLYPMVREKLDDGDRIAEFEIRQHAEIERTMKELDRLDAGTIEFLPTVRRLEVLVREHAGQEEADLLPALGAVLTTQERLALGAKHEAAKKLAPTHPHPAAPDRPPLNKVLGPGISLVDRVRDFVTGRRA
jgi:hemerythrin superfamily protein